MLNAWRGEVRGDSYQGILQQNFTWFSSCYPTVAIPKYQWYPRAQSNCACTLQIRFLCTFDDVTKIIRYWPCIEGPLELSLLLDLESLRFLNSACPGVIGSPSSSKAIGFVVLRSSRADDFPGLRLAHSSAARSCSLSRLALWKKYWIYIIELLISNQIYWSE